MEIILFVVAFTGLAILSGLFLWQEKRISQIEKEIPGIARDASRARTATLRF